MKLYQSPGGTWCGSEKDYKAAMKLEGLDPKTQARKQVDVPVDKAGLMEFLTFHNVNVINPPHTAAPEVTGGDAPPAPPQSPPVAPTTMLRLTLDEQVENLPITAQLDILVGIADRAHKAIWAK